MFTTSSSCPGGAEGIARVYLVRACDALASASATYAIPLLILITTGSSALTGLAFVLEWLPRLTAFAVAGSMVTRWGAGRVFRAANLIRSLVVALAAGALTWLPATGTAPTGAVMTLAALSGMLAEISFVAVETMSAQASHTVERRMPRVQAAQAGIDQAALLAGPLLAGVLLVHANVLLVLVAVLALTAAAATPSTQTRVTDHPVGGGPSPMSDRRVRGGLLTGWRTVRHKPTLAWLVYALTASNLAIGVLQTAAPITVVRRFHSSTADVGMMWSATAAASLLAICLTRRAIERWHLWPVGAVAAALSTAACLTTALAPSYRVYIVAIAALMAADGTLTVVLRTLRSRLMPADLFGPAMAVTVLLLLLPMPVAGVLVAVIPAAGLPHLLLACAVLQGLVLAGCFGKLRHHFTPFSPPAPPASAPASVPVLLTGLPTRTESP